MKGGPERKKADVIVVIVYSSTIRPHEEKKFFKDVVV